MKGKTSLLGFPKAARPLYIQSATRRGVCVSTTLLSVFTYNFTTLSVECACSDFNIESRNLVAYMFFMTLWQYGGRLLLLPWCVGGCFYEYAIDVPTTCTVLMRLCDMTCVVSSVLCCITRVESSWKETCFMGWLPHHDDWRPLPEE